MSVPSPRATAIPLLSQFESFRSYLAAWQLHRQCRDPAFTRSEFARRLGVPNSRGILGEIIEGRKLTDSFLERFVQVLELGQEEARLFRGRVRYEQAESEAERALFRPHLPSQSDRAGAALTQAALDAFQGIVPAELDDTCRQIVEATRSQLGHVRAGLLLLLKPDDFLLHGTWGTDHHLCTTDERSYVIGRLETIDRVVENLAKTGTPWQLRNPASLGHVEGEQRIVVSHAWVEGHLLTTPRRHLGVLYVDPGLSLREPNPELQEATRVWARLISPLLERAIPVQVQQDGNL